MCSRPCMLHHQLGGYIQRQLCNAMKDCDQGKRAILSGLKLQLLLLHRGGLDDLDEQEEVHHQCAAVTAAGLDTCASINAEAPEGGAVPEGKQFEERRRGMRESAATVATPPPPPAAAAARQIKLPSARLRKRRTVTKTAGGLRAHQRTRQGRQKESERWAALDAFATETTQRLQEMQESMQVNQGHMLLALERMKLSTQAIELLLRTQGAGGESEDDMGHSRGRDKARTAAGHGQGGWSRARSRLSRQTRSKATPLSNQTTRGRARERWPAPDGGDSGGPAESAAEMGSRPRTLSLSPDSFAIVSRWVCAGRGGLMGASEPPSEGTRERVHGWELEQEADDWLRRQDWM